MNANEKGLLQSAINNEKLATVVLYSYRYYFRKFPLIDQNGDILRQRRYLIEMEQYRQAFHMTQERNREFYHNTSLFPKEIWNLILDYFVASVYDFFRFGRICRYWRDIADHSHLWFTRSLQFTIPERLFKILMKDYKYVTKAKEEKFLLTLLEEQATKGGIINLCHQTLRQSGFYQNRITSKDLQALGGHAALLHTMKCDVVRLIDGPEIFNYDFILRNTTLIERESLAYDMKLKMSALLRSYHYWWSWHATYRPKLYSMLNIFDMISPRIFNQFIYWIGMLSLVNLLFTFDEEFPKFLSLSSPFQSNQNHSLDVQAPDLLHVTFNYEKLSYWIGFSVLYGLLGSYFFLIFKYVFEYVCKEYIFIGSVNRLTFLPIQLNIPWKDVILQDSYVIFLMNLALLSLGLFINTFLLQMKVMTISSNDFPLMMNNSTTTATTSTMTTTTTVLSSLCTLLNSFLSWKLIFSFFSIVMMTFIYIQMKLFQKDYQVSSSHSSSSSSHSSFSIRQLFEVEMLYSFLFYGLMIFWLITSLGNYFLGDYFDRNGIEDIFLSSSPPSIGTTLEQSTIERYSELRRITFYYFPFSGLLLLYAVILLFVVIFIFFHSNFYDDFGNLRILTLPGMNMIYCFLSALLLFYSLLHLLLIGLHLSFPNSVFENHFSPLTLFLLFINGFYGSVIGVFILNK